MHCQTWIYGIARLPVKEPSLILRIQRQRITCALRLIRVQIMAAGLNKIDLHDKQVYSDWKNNVPIAACSNCLGMDL